MSPASYVLRCMKCSWSEGPESSALTCPKCGSPIEAIYDYEKLRSSFSGLPKDEKQPGIWKYAPLLPITSATKPVTLGEGTTPLPLAKKIGERLGLPTLYVKDESRNPTLSFKDRKSAMAITKGLEMGVKAVACISAGNAGASVAAYASRAGIPSYIFTFKGINESKVAKLISYGGSVFRTRADAATLTKFLRGVCERYGFANMTAATRYNPYIKEGAKTGAFELYEQLNGLPDWIAIPIGGGGNVSSYFKAFKELKSLGLIERYPKIIGAQAKYSAPVVEAFRKRLPADRIPTINGARTIAHSILDEWAPDGDQALTAIRETGGTAVGVSDDEILDSMKWLSGVEGLFVEPASAAPLAAVRKLKKQGKIDASESVVMVATGSGSNQPAATIKAWGMPPMIDTDLSKFSRVLRRS